MARGGAHTNWIAVALVTIVGAGPSAAAPRAPLTHAPAWGPLDPHADACVAGAAPNSLSGGAAPCGISHALRAGFAPGKAARPPRTALAQNVAAPPAAAPKFDVVSIKPFAIGPGARPRPLAMDPMHLHADVTLRALILSAYGITEPQLLGGEDWTRTQYFSLDATAPAPATPDQMRLMLQAALATRFELKLSHVAHQTPAWALVVAPGGLKAAKLGEDEHPHPTRKPGAGECYATLVETMEEFKDYLNYPRNPTGRPVVDQTGLPGKYNLYFFLPCDQTGLMSLEKWSVQPAMREQFGLDLAPTVIQQDVYTIVGAHRPAIGGNLEAPLAERIPAAGY